MAWSNEGKMNQQNIRTEFYEKPPPSFLSLSKSDQGRKLTLRQVIETNWEKDIQDCIPLEIIPRATGNNRSKGVIGEGAEESPWWLWSLKFLEKLRTLSKITKNDLARAQRLMLEQVRQRQRDMTARSRNVAEILPTDVGELIDVLVKQFIKDNGLEDPRADGSRIQKTTKVKRERVDSLQPEQLEEHKETKKIKLERADSLEPEEATEECIDQVKAVTESEMEEEQYAGTIDQEDHRQYIRQTPVVAAQTPTECPAAGANLTPKSLTSERARTTPTTQKSAAASLFPNKRQENIHITSDQGLQVLKLRGKAMRHRQEAARLEAEAYELEAKALHASE